MQGKYSSGKSLIEQNIQCPTGRHPHMQINVNGADNLHANVFEGILRIPFEFKIYDNQFIYDNHDVVLLYISESHIGISNWTMK